MDKYMVFKFLPPAIVPPSLLAELLICPKAQVSLVNQYTLAIVHVETPASQVYGVLENTNT